MAAADRAACCAWASAFLSRQCSARYLQLSLSDYIARAVEDSAAAAAASARTRGRSRHTRSGSHSEEGSIREPYASVTDPGPPHHGYDNRIQTSGEPE